MQLIAIQKDGTTTVELTDEEAHAIRDALANATHAGAAWTLHRLLSHAHGDTVQSGDSCSTCSSWYVGDTCPHCAPSTR